MSKKSMLCNLLPWPSGQARSLKLCEIFDKAAAGFGEAASNESGLARPCVSLALRA